MMNFQMNDVAIYECLANTMNFMHPGMYLHQLRVAILADKIAEQINLSKQRREVLFYAALIHDIGRVFARPDKAQSTDETKNAYVHAQAGYELLKNYSFFHHIGEVILHHHDWWDGSHPKSDSYEMRMIPIESRIICIAEEAVVYLDDTTSTRPLADLHDYLKTMGLHKLDPDLLEAFAEISFLDKVWKDYTWPNLKVHFKKYTGDSYLRNIPLKDIKAFAEVLVALLEQWSALTARHVRLVAKLSAQLAELRNFDADAVTCIYIAGLLHDLGKVAIAQELLNKQSELTAEEYKAVQKHAYYTYWLLSQVNGLEDIAKWAAYHHETLDGKGYPFGLNEYKLSEEARIIAVVEVFAALVADRTYHNLVSLEKIKKLMQNMAKTDKVDKSIVKTVFNNMGALYPSKEVVNH